MPAAKIFLTSADISAVMGISIRQAQYTLNMLTSAARPSGTGERRWLI